MTCDISTLYLDTHIIVHFNGFRSLNSKYIIETQC